MVRALKLGADGFLLKDVDPARLVEPIRRVVAGERALSPDVTSTLITVVTETPGGDGIAHPAGTRRVAQLLAQGLTNGQIGTRLNLSLASVKAHLTSVFTKLRGDNRVSAAMVVRDAGA